MIPAILRGGRCGAMRASTAVQMPARAAGTASRQWERVRKPEERRVGISRDHE